MLKPLKKNPLNRGADRRQRGGENTRKNLLLILVRSRREHLLAVRDFQNPHHAIRAANTGTGPLHEMPMRYYSSEPWRTGPTPGIRLSELH